MIHLSNYKKSYSGRLILTIPDFHLSKGIYWIKGINGSGKSTLFKCIAGIIEFEGNILINDISVKKSPVIYRSQVSYSEAEPLFPDFLTLKDIAEFVAKTKKASGNQLEELKSTLGVHAYYNDRISTFSSGMLKKAGLLVAFLGKPKVIILDEPFITLDAASSDRLLALIVRLHAQEGVSFLLSSHRNEENTSLEFNGVFSIIDQKLVSI